jgi:hypothetical protein
VAKSWGRAQKRFASVSKTLPKCAEAEWVGEPLQRLHQSQHTCLSIDRPREAKVSIIFPLCDWPVLLSESESRPELRAVKLRWQNCSTIGLTRYGRAELEGKCTDEVQFF